VPEPGTRFAGRRALVTGTASGIGREVAVALAAEGADVAIAARSVEGDAILPGSLQETADRMTSFGGTVAMVTADLADADDRSRLVPEAEVALGGPVEILVNNAVAAIFRDVLDFDLKRRRMLFEVNLHAPLDLCAAVAPPMVEAGEGWIVNVTSGGSRSIEGPPFERGVLGSKEGIYGATKAALNRASNALAMELEADGVRVNTVEPNAAVMTDGAAAVVGGKLRPEQLEPVEAMVAAVLALCDGPPERTGGHHVSLALLDELGIEVPELAAMRGGA
jgi:NAD(P)-dependent dehydrogenase (short-subunit alcohol dehydrogenase family)